jgi:hypothetical protein
MKTVVLVLTSMVAFIFPAQAFCANCSVAIHLVHAVKVDSCEGKWELVKARIADSKVKLKLTTTKEGQAILKWSGKDGMLATLNIHMARGPISALGEVEMCERGATMSIYDDSYSIKELRIDGKLGPGYYAVRVVYHPSGGPAEISDWIVIRIK